MRRWSVLPHIAASGRAAPVKGRLPIRGRVQARLSESDKLTSTVGGAAALADEWRVQETKAARADGDFQRRRVAELEAELRKASPNPQRNAIPSSVTVRGQRAFR